MQSYKLGLDLGHGIAKGATASGHLMEYRHAIAQLSESQWQNVISLSGRTDTPVDYIRVNGVPYVVGDKAESFSMQRLTGASRYTKEYYGVMAMAMIARLYSANNFDIELFCSHPPGHVDYVDDLFSSVSGQWELECRGGTYRVNVVNVDAFDEPTGGIMNVMLSQNGTSYQHPELRDQRILTIDIGYGTTDTIIFEDQQVDYGTAQTIPVGISKVVSNFENEFRIRYRNEVRETMALNPKQIRSAIVTGQFKGGGNTWACQEEAQQSRNILVNEIVTHIQSQRGGGFNYDGILLTGGGSALLYDELEKRINNNNIMLASDLNQMHFANIAGGMKLWKMYEHLGA